MFTLYTAGLTARYGHKVLHGLKLPTLFLKNSTGTSGSELLRKKIMSITSSLSTGAAGGTMEQAHSVTWRATLSSLRSVYSVWVIPPKLKLVLEASTLVNSKE